MKHSSTRIAARAWVYAGLLLNTYAAAGIEQSLGNHDVRSLVVRETQHVMIYTGSHTNPDGCTKGTEVVVKAEHPGYAAMIATVLAAKATRTLVDFGVDGCFSAYGHTYPVVTSLTWN